jgi:hypothetical protein
MVWMGEAMVAGTNENGVSTLMHGHGSNRDAIFVLKGLQ